MSNVPLLGDQRSGNGHKRRQSSKVLLNVVTSLGTVVPYSTAYDGIALMLNSNDSQERDELTRNWRDHKLEELNFVGTVGALLASCLSSTSAWPDVLTDGRDKPWFVRSLWFSGLVFALFAVLIAGIQSMRLHRLSAHRDGLKKIRVGLGRRRSAGGDMIPHRIQVLAWEASQFFLVLSVILMVTGVAVLVWVSTQYGSTDGSGWHENFKMAITFTSVLGFACIVLLTSQTALMGTDQVNDEE
ncbi:hypothetical protein N3K66_002798 [Trichothecium roseum]|uniref:Uncharacterized protein n=1 Tax=Trichothecium roseum TaxID=47278 RepID=A0ACC0VAF0_9HYPO|nr:hypothetical protein N3K66_002798 [Trichothecium roseum]